MGLVGYLVLLALFIYALHEPDPFLHVDNESGRPLLLDRDAPLAPGTTGQAMLVLGHEGWWVTRGYDCEQDRLVARDVQGTVIARHTGACGSDTWTITGEGLPAAPQHRRGQVP